MDSKDTETENEPLDIVSDDAIFVAPITNIKKEIDDAHFQVGLNALQGILYFFGCLKQTILMLDYHIIFFYQILIY